MTAAVETYFLAFPNDEKIVMALVSIIVDERLASFFTLLMGVKMIFHDIIGLL